jgi:hypothetical protein
LAAFVATGSAHAEEGTFTLGAYAAQNGRISNPPQKPGAQANPPTSSSPNTQQSGGRSLLPFWLDLSRAESRTRALILPPVFIDRRARDNDKNKPFFHADLSLTFGWHSQKIAGRRWFNPAGLFFGGFSESSTRWAAVPLLMGYSRRGDDFTFGQFPLVWWWGNKTTSNFLAIPLYFRNKRPNSMLSTAALVFWRGNSNLDDADPSNDLRYTVAGPLFVHVETHRRSIYVAPLWLSGVNRYRGREHKTFAPFFHWHRSEFGNREALITPFWSHSQDRARAASSWSIPPLLSFETKNRDRHLRAITPLFWQGKDSRYAAKFWAAGPVGDYQDEQQRVSWFAPIYWSFHDRRFDARTRAFLPLALIRKNPEGRRVDTLLGFGQSRADGWSVGVHPLLSYAGRNGSKSYAVALGGAFWTRRTDPQHWSAGVGPLAYVRRRSDGMHWGVLPALVFAGKSTDLRYQVVTPLFWHIGRGQADVRNDLWIAATGYVRSEATGSAFGLAPLFFARRGKDRSYVAIPALLSGYRADHKKGEWSFISPLVVAGQTPTSTTFGALGLFWRAKRGHTTHTSLAPLFYSRQAAGRDLLLTPVGASWERNGAREWIFGPFFGKHSTQARTAGLFPLLAWHRKDDPDAAIRSATVIAPLYLGVHGKAQDVDFVTPLGYNIRTYGAKPRHAFGFAPLYIGQRQSGGLDYDAGPGWVWARTPSRETHTLIAGPFFHRLTRKRLTTGLFPLVWWTDSTTTRNLFAFPLLLHRENKAEHSHLTIALPLWFDRQSSQFQRTWAALPFAFGKERRNRFLRMSILPPGFVDAFSVHRNRRITGFLPLAFRVQKCGFQENDDPKCRYTLYGALPFAAFGRDGQGRRSHSLLSLYWYDRDAGGTKLYTWLAGGNYRPNEKLMWYAGPVFRSTTRTHTTTGVLPLWYSRKHRARDRSTSLLLPPLFIGQHKDDSRWFEAGLVAWSFRSPHKSTLLVAPPVFGYQHAFSGHKTIWLAPFFIDHQNLHDRARTTAVLPGLFLRNKSAESATTIQVPLIWHFKRPASTTTVIPGLLVRHQTATRTAGVVGPALGVWWRHTAGDVTLDRHWRIVFGLFGGGQEFGRRYASIFGLKIRGNRNVDAKATLSPAADAKATK